LEAGVYEDVVRASWTMPPHLLYALVMEAAAPMASIDLDRY
jgi:hypothetical protein